jgi:hypothetical protein
MEKACNRRSFIQRKSSQNMYKKEMLNAVLQKFFTDHAPHI